MALLARRRHFRYILAPIIGQPSACDGWTRGKRARSSAGEHYVDIVGVTGSIPVAPTIRNAHLRLVMKVRNSLKSLRKRHRDNRVVRRKGRVYIINKTEKRFKARQG